jgi:hypothetical protein
MENLPKDIWWCDDVIPYRTQERFRGFISQSLYDWNDFNHIKTSGVYGEMDATPICDEMTVMPSDALIKLAYANNGRHAQILNETTYWLGMAVLDEYARRNNVVITEIQRMKVNNQTKSMWPDWNGENCCNEIHFDNSIPGNRTLVYYINDSDGDTILFDALYEGVNKEYKMNTLMRVTPKQGRAVVFDTWRFHAPQNPTYTPRRYLLNINFMEMKA